MDLDLTVQKATGGPGGGPASRGVLRRGGAMAGAPELAGVRWLLVSEHRFKKEKHQRDEELTANSRRCFAGAEE